MKSTFGTTKTQHHWWSIFIVFSVIRLVVGTPLQRIHRLEVNVRRELQSVTPGAEIPRKCSEGSKNMGDADSNFLNSISSGPTGSIGEPFGTVGSWCLYLTHNDRTE